MVAQGWLIQTLTVDPDFDGQARGVAGCCCRTTPVPSPQTPDAHANSIEHIFPKLGETTTTAEILDMLRRTK